MLGAMPNPSGPVRVFVLGDARILTPVAEIEPTAEVVFAAALYLVLQRNDPVSRRRLESLLWPEAESNVASHRLRQTILKLRKLGVSIESVGSSRLKITCAVFVDADTTEIQAYVHTRADSCSLVPLSGYEPRVSHPYSEWLETKRNEIRASLTQEMLIAISQRRSRGDWLGVEVQANRLIEFDPFNEEATLALAESHAMRGCKLDGLQILDRYLAELGRSSGEIGLPASIMRKRIAERMPTLSQSEPYRPPFVGRGDSMASICSLLPRVKEGNGGTLHVWGDAGIGKTRLLSEFANFGALQGVSNARATCRATDPHRPLSVFVDLVPLLLRMRGAIGCSPETLQYLDRLTRHTSDPATWGGVGEATFVYARLQQSIFDLIDAVAQERPLLIVVEDVHRLDQVSARIFSDLISWATANPVILAFTGREKSYQWLDQPLTSALDIHLQPLDAAAAQELINELVRQCGRQIPDHDQAWCARVAEGNPYFLAELVTHLAETGGGHAAPPSLAAVINQRLNRLTRETLQLLQTCALLDKNCSIDRIEKVLGYPHHELLQSLNELGNLGMLVLERADNGGESFSRLVPRHELLAVAAENSLTAPAQAYLHRCIGSVLEAEVADNGSTSLLWDCAKHWQRAGNSTRAFSLVRSCAEHLMKLGLCDAAAEAYEKSRTFCSSDTERIEMLRGEVAAHFGASNWLRLAETSVALKNLEAYVSPAADGHDDIELMTLRALWQTGQLNVVKHCSLKCLGCETASVRHRVSAGIMGLMMFDLECDHVEMTKTFQRLLPLLEGAETDDALRYEARMVFETACGDLERAVESSAALVNAKRQSSSVADLTRALSNASAAARTAGRIPLAREWLVEALSIFESHKLTLASEIPLQQLASIALDENDIEEASRWYERLAELPASTLDATFIRRSIGVRIALCKGDVAAARNLVWVEINELQKDNYPHRRVYELALLMAVELADGHQPPQALLSLLEDSHLIARANARQAFATFVLVCALRKAGRPERGATLLAEYCDKYRREPTPPPFHVLHLMESLAGLTS
jgi:DNA-binding SARP family transcriptional activator/tetratricopeptide (TPR) repeat protein